MVGLNSGQLWGTQNFELKVVKWALGHDFLLVSLHIKDCVEEGNPEDDFERDVCCVDRISGNSVPVFQSHNSAMFSLATAIERCSDEDN